MRNLAQGCGITDAPRIVRSRGFIILTWTSQDAAQHPNVDFHLHSSEPEYMAKLGEPINHNLI